MLSTWLFCYVAGVAFLAVMIATAMRSPGWYMMRDQLPANAPNWAISVALMMSVLLWPVWLMAEVVKGALRN